jgi:hypothetical protein
MSTACLANASSRGWSECAEDLYCSLLYGTCRPFSQEGEACAFADRNTIFPDPRTQLVRCAEHLFCDYVTDRCVVGCQVGAPCDEIAADPETPQCDEEQELICILGRCDQPRTEGLPCGEDADCVEGLHCSPDPNDASQTELICQPPFDFDRPCSRHAQCLSQFCHPDTLLCTGRVGPDGPCLTGDDAECRDGFCIRLDPNLPCTSVADCYCQALRADGESCSQDRQCASEACVAGACQQLPVPDGERCDEATDCASEYCNLAEAEPTCAELPLGLGAACDPAQAADCESGVCYDAEQTGETVCTEGLEEGQECDPSDPTVVPCDPRRFYCDRWDRQPAVCVPWLETGDLCDTGVACRSQLCEPGGEPQPSSRPGRRMCVPAIPEGAAFCDNED